MPESPAGTNRGAASHAARSEFTTNPAQPGQTEDANVGSSISTSWVLIATFDSDAQYENYKKSHAEGFYSGRDRRCEAGGCVLLASLGGWTCTDFDCFAICRWKYYKCKRCCDPSEAKVDSKGKKDYSKVVPKCGIVYRSGRWTKSGTKAKGCRGGSLSGTSGTQEQNTYETRDGKIRLYRRRLAGSSGCHVSLNPDFVMFGVLPSHGTDSC